MAINEPASLSVQDALRDLAMRLDAAAHGECTSMIEAFSGMYDWSKARVYRALRQVGWSSGRKPRADRGTTSQDICSACIQPVKSTSATCRRSKTKRCKASRS
jgi:hypothetical protein